MRGPKYLLRWLSLKFFSTGCNLRMKLHATMNMKADISCSKVEKVRQRKQPRHSPKAPASFSAQNEPVPEMNQCCVVKNTVVCLLCCKYIHSSGLNQRGTKYRCGLGLGKASREGTEQIQEDLTKQRKLESDSACEISKKSNVRKSSLKASDLSCGTKLMGVGKVTETQGRGTFHSHLPHMRLLGHF
ncbi:hypothetical protein Y1Q_0000732 [Alligator mississippiensis]|uniref:Uncharacterized protein n=1 Tax=Alligator mississippiensis TaxID=8496 RepID=A0A151MC99_ALLMI|nr:hypothetical protein Y1Q_0000732 [Alligator mississippiensis]